MSRLLGDYAGHSDPLTAACNRIALLVAWNQPFYPLYLWWTVGGDWWVACWTFLSTPVFASVPAVARRSALAGRVMVPLTGIANGMVSTKAFGTPSGVELFLIPCVLIALLGFHRREVRSTVTLLGMTAAALLLRGRYGIPLGRFTALEYQHFFRLNAFSVAALSIVILWLLIRARGASVRR